LELKRASLQAARRKLLLNWDVARTIEAKENEQSDIHCSLCGSSGLWIFCEVPEVPASYNLLWKSKDEAINCPKGKIKLAFCPFCTFVTNIALEPARAS